MKTRIANLTAIFVLLLLGSVVLRQTQSGALAQSNGLPLLAGYTARQGAASGGHYRLTSLTLRSTQGDAWQEIGGSSGGGYRLIGLASRGGGNQCCCTYLPCVLK